MNCLQNLQRSCALPFQGFKGNPRKALSCSINMMEGMKSSDMPRSMEVKAISGSTPSAKQSNSESEEEVSKIYSHNMTEAMGATFQEDHIPLPCPDICRTLVLDTALTYRHELGMNYNFICPDLIVGSCLQTPQDVEKLRKVGVKTIFCLQQDPDLEYFGVDISAIQDYAKKCGDIEHIRAQIRDFDSFDLRMRLPGVVSELYRAINRNGGVTYVHCTAGLGRAPAVALAYIFWVQGYKLSDAHKLLLSKRACFPKLDAIKSATADILTDLKKELVTLTWEDNKCSTVEVSGLDIGWGQALCSGICYLDSLVVSVGYNYATDTDIGTSRKMKSKAIQAQDIVIRIPLKFDKEHRSWTLQRELPEGHYEYKYIVDGEWTYNKFEPVTTRNKDGHINNFVHVADDDPNTVNASVRKRFTSEDPDLTKEERTKIRQFLETYPNEE